MFRAGQLVRCVDAAKNVNWDIDTNLEVGKVYEVDRVLFGGHGIGLVGVKPPSLTDYYNVARFVAVEPRVLLASEIRDIAEESYRAWQSSLATFDVIERAIGEAQKRILGI